MKKIFLFFVGIIYLSLSSCSEEIMDGINANPNDPNDVNSGLIITDVMVSTAFKVVGGDYCYYASTYTEHNVGIYNQMYNAETRRTEPIVASTYNNAWEAAYNNLYRAKLVINKCSAGGSEEGNYHTLGIAQILSAINLATITDCVGNTPWSESGKPGEIFMPKLDTQEDIYNDVIQLLEDAVANLQKESSYDGLGEQDVIFGSENSSEMYWIRTAYGLLSRYTMRLPDRANNYDKVIEYANKSFESSDQECKVMWSQLGAISPFAAFFRDRDYYGASQSFKDKLDLLQDPRSAYFWKKHPNAKEDGIRFAKNGDAEDLGQVQAVYSISALSDAAAPTFLISYHEVEFLKAEALTRLGHTNDAEAALKNALLASFLKISGVIGKTEAEIEAEVADYYTNLVEPRYEIDGLREVMLQKYIACFEEEALEAYYDIRRLMAMGEADIIKLSHPEPAKFPLRYTYGSSDVSTNDYVAEAYSNVDVYTDHVWWADGTK